MPAPTIRHISDLCFSTVYEDLDDLYKQYFPVGLTWAELITWGLRIETWKYEVTGGIVDSGSGVASIDGTFNGAQRVGKPNENSFACGLGDWTEGPVASATGASASLTLQLFAAPVIDFKIVKNADGTLFYPALYIDYFLPVEYAPDEEATIEGTSLYGTETPDFNATVFGKSVPIKFYESGDTSGITNISEITISPLSWYPYEPNAGGGPIVDSATGELLRQL